MLLLLALALAQTPEPPPAPIDAPATEEPATTDAPPVVETPPQPGELPTPDQATPPPAPPPVDGLDGFTTGLVQAGVGGVTAGLFQTAVRVLAIFAVTNPVVANIYQSIACFYCAFGPALVGVLETSVGDAVGKRRSGALWPMLGAYGAACVVGAVQCGVISFFLGSLFAQCASGNFAGAIATINTAPELQLALLILDIIQPIAIAVTPAIVYAMSAKDKPPGDPGGFGMPGIVEPAFPAPTTPAPATPGAVTAQLRPAMRF